MIESTQYLTKHEIDGALAKYAGVLGYTRKYTWDWNSNLKSTMGLAYGARDYMEFAPLTFVPATPYQRLETIVHELCHLVRFWEPGDFKWCSYSMELKLRHDRGHDSAWKFLMMRCGFKGERCHTVIPLGSKRRKR